MCWFDVKGLGSGFRVKDLYFGVQGFRVRNWGLGRPGWSEAAGTPWFNVLGIRVQGFRV